MSEMQNNHKLDNQEKKISNSAEKIYILSEEIIMRIIIINSNQLILM